MANRNYRNLGHTHSYDISPGIKLLFNYLSRFYSLEHKLILYEAAQYPGFSAKIEILPLKQIEMFQFSPLSTLYIPPVDNPPYNKEILKALGIKASGI